VSDVDDASLLADVGTRIRALRHASDLSLEQLGERAGVHPTHLSAVELGRRNPSLITLGRIAEGLGTHIASLLDDRQRLTAEELRPLLRERLDEADAERLRLILRVLDAVE